MWSDAALAADAPETFDVMHQLIGLLDAALAADVREAASGDVVALRRALRGKQLPQDGARLERFEGSRLCLVSAPVAALAAVQRELARTPGVLVDTWETGLVALVPDGLLPRAVARVHRLSPDAAVGVSTPLGSGWATRALDEATRALSLCDAGGAVRADDAWFEITVSRLRDSVRDSLAVDGPLARLDDLAPSGVDLRATLATWLAHDGDVRAAAAELHLHPNSLRYRLRRAAEITGIDLGDPLQRLVAHLALSTE